MKTILVANTGSSSVKFTLFLAADLRIAASGLVERIGLEGTRLVYRRPGLETVQKRVAIPDIGNAIAQILPLLTDSRMGVIRSKEEIRAIGHRVVHGGEYISRPSLIDDRIKQIIQDCFDLAPLHNPPNLEGILACESGFPDIPQVAVFDTAFHATIPPQASLYALPLKLCEELKIRKYGFHGTSHHYVSRKAAEWIGRPVTDLRLITCHLGNGCSITAIAGGQSVDTSMGFTPLEGVPMGTRCGDMDPAILFYLMRQRGMSAEQLDILLNRESGLLGLGGSSDVRDLVQAMHDGHHPAETALRVFTYRIKKYIGAYLAVLGGADAIVFTAGIGENSPLIREWICEGMTELGIRLDPHHNHAVNGHPGEIQDPESRVRLLIVPTNEEAEIAIQTRDLITGINGGFDTK
ncbi:MAG: acetate kinase [Desulfatirhabdiaceae bacterium]|nr:acetate kinase [Desulfatirhabdiaceae bacterium]